ncbi:pilus assembly protein PilO [Niallia oryzisoli]|uniref:Pilus assembly protein PilO n=1 Tax=Niallia oryzisoli TaxID=1737571 RepID=A0ABZ2CJ49_9BACI
MNFSSPKKHHWIIVIGILLVAGIIAGGDCLYLQPLNDKLERKQTELDMANQQLTSIENKTAENEEHAAESTRKLQLLVPVKRQLEQLILDIEKAEVISNVMIDEISMNGTEADEKIEVEQETNQTEAENQTDAEGTEAGTEEVNQEAADTEGNAETGGGKAKEQETTPKEEPLEIVEVALPAGVNRTSITIKGQAENYFDLEKFIDSLQSLKRIVAIDNLSFKGRDEIMNVDQVEEKAEFELAISAYYYPALEDLLNELPPIDAPAAANKKNPLNGFSNDVTNK